MDVSLILLIIVGLLALSLGLLAGYFFKREDYRNSKMKAEADSQKIIRKAEQDAHAMEKKTQQKQLESERKAQQIMTSAEHKAIEKEKDLERQSVNLEHKEKELDQKVNEITKQREQLKNKETEIINKQEKLDGIIVEQTEVLEKVAGMDKAAALDKLLENIKQQKQGDLLRQMRALDYEFDEKVEKKAKKAISEAIQRYASEVTSDATQTVLELASDDMKGRIIGREGRNINALERATGVDFIIDDSPGIVILSGYDLLRRYIAKKSVERLIEDGRIHPARIEEIVLQETENADKLIKKFGEKAAEEVGVLNILPPEIIKVLGRLRFRTSYGQNVLQHSVEVAFLAESLANQIGADPERAKLAGLLHDLGKSISHEVGGRHAIIGAEICRKFNIDKMVTNAVEAHHEDVEKECLEAYLVQAADAISAARPGARRDTTEQFIKRMKQQEEIVNSFDGVVKNYIMSSGRETWVFVKPDVISDLQAKELADNIARKLESELTYPGEIKVTVFRETRVKAIAK